MYNLSGNSMELEIFLIFAFNINKSIHYTMKKTIILGLVALIGVLTSCGGPTTTEPKLHVIFDNPAPRTMPLALFGEVPSDLVASLDIADGIPSSVSVMLLEKDGQQLLFDGGNGNEDSRLLPCLQELGFAPSDIDEIFITHLHGDHIGGLVKDNQPVFPQAKLYIPSVELDAWTQAPNVQALVTAYGENVVKFAIGDALPCSVEAMAAYGHTPGHTIYRTDDKLIVGDIMHGLALQMEHPDFCARFDMDQEKAIASRKAVMEQVKKEGWTMFGMHFPTVEGVKVE